MQVSEIFTKGFTPTTTARPRNDWDDDRHRRHHDDHGRHGWDDDRRHWHNR